MGRNNGGPDMSQVVQGNDDAVAARRRGWRRRHARAKAAVWLLGPMAMVLLAFQLQPGAAVLDIPVVPNKTGYFWWEEERAQLAYADASGVLIILRRVGTAYPEMQGWHTVEDAFDHFERWLTGSGWLHIGSVDGMPELPESRLLAAGNRRLYRRGRTDPEFAHLAIWPVGGTVEGFHVVLVTTRPSWLHRLSRGFD
jgi:hypothetical protein